MSCTSVELHCKNHQFVFHWGQYFVTKFSSFEVWLLWWKMSGSGTNQHQLRKISVYWDNSAELFGAITKIKTVQVILQHGYHSPEEREQTGGFSSSRVQQLFCSSGKRHFRCFCLTVDLGLKTQQFLNYFFLGGGGGREEVSICLWNHAYIKVWPSIPVCEYSHHTRTKGQKNSSGNGLDRKVCSSRLFCFWFSV